MLSIQRWSSISGGAASTVSRLNATYMSTNIILTINNPLQKIYSGTWESPALPLRKVVAAELPVNLFINLVWRFGLPCRALQ